MPADDDRKLASALGAGADAVILDLEDAVAPAAKQRARERAAAALAAPASRCLRMVRVNGLDSGLMADDLASLAAHPPDAVVLPKATPEAVAAMGDGPPVVALIETAEGLRRAYEVARAPRVAMLMLGGVDLGVALRLKPRTDGLELLVPRTTVVVDSAAAGLPAPVDVVHLATRDEAGLVAQAELARSLGFGAKACIHPAQVEPVNRAFSPSEAEVARARQTVAAYEEALAQGQGAVAVDGQMVDVAVVARARDVISAAMAPSARKETT